MLDVAVIRENPELVRSALRNRLYEEEILDRFLEIDGEWRRLVDESNQLKRQRNIVAEEIPTMSGEEKKGKIGEMKDVSNRIKHLDARIAELENERDEVVLNIPNIPHESVPVGASDEDNLKIREFGSPTDFDFRPKDHIEIAEDLDIIDFARGTKITGSGFYVLKGDGARLERALINYMLDLHRGQGYTEIFPPVIVNKNSVIGTGQYPKLKDDMYWIERDDLWLNPTAEVPVTNLLADEILEKEDLPIYYTAYLPSFRREAGKHADTKGIIRVHQFNKVEMVKFVLPENSFDELETLLDNAEDVLRDLKLPYRVMTLCTGDLGFAAAKCYDIEAYAPGSDKWLEVSSCSCFTDFQARRARVKYRPKPHMKSEFVHTLNGSGIALPRTMVAVLENFQNKDGTVTIPEILRPYMQGQELIE
ncbi:MAG: serine--tRNA ligase [Methanomassiliicoccales archaeon]|nr:serine--tRNA ligase [Methanomassiliicoccales archaeon]NYT14673.1 serine--tRNA ligase [Methanomassiliicoccales archaeon]